MEAVPVKPIGRAPAIHLSSGTATHPQSGQNPSSSCVLHRQGLSLHPHCEPGLAFTKGWRAMAKAGITLAKLPVLRQQKGSQSCSSSGLSQVSPAFSERVAARFLGYPTQISWKRKGRPLESKQGLYGGDGSYVGADGKIWHLRSQHHQKILLTSPTQTLVSQGPSGSPLLRDCLRWGIRLESSGTFSACFVCHFWMKLLVCSPMSWYTQFPKCMFRSTHRY